MANELVLIDRQEDPLDYYVTNATGIEKGTLCSLTDSGTAIICTVPDSAIAGVAAREKIASDGRTQLAIYKRGRFFATASGTITIGSALASAGDVAYPNTVKVISSGDSGAAIIGYSEEAATDKERFQMRLNL